MGSWIDAVIRFVLVSSALLLALGGISFMVVSVFKIHGKARLWICSLLILMPLTYPIHVLFPDNIKILIPLQKVGTLFLDNFGTSPRTKVSSEDSLSVNNISSATDTLTPPDLYGATHQPQTPVSGKPLNYSINWRLTLAIAWFCMCIIFLVRLGLIVKNTRLLVRCADQAKDPHIQQLLRQCTTETGLRRTPQILTADNLSIPMAVGFIDPAIILPKRLLEPEFHEGLRFTLLHELKHLQRYDNWWLALESLINATYFFHPVIYWVKNKVHEEREFFCDSHVIQVTNKSALYADFLLHEIWKQSLETNPVVAMPFILSTPKTIKRVRFILQKRTPSLFSKIRDRLAVLVILISFASILFCTITPSAHIKDDGAHRNITLLNNHGEINDSSI